MNLPYDINQHPLPHKKDELHKNNILVQNQLSIRLKTGRETEGRHHPFQTQDTKLYASKSTNKGLPSLGQHHPHKLLVIHLAIAIHVSFSDHLLHFFVRQFLPEICHHMSKLHVSGKHQHRVETISPERRMSIADEQYIIQFTTGLVTI